MSERLLDSNLTNLDSEGLSLRPLKLDEYIGQEDIKEMLEIYIKAAKQRDESLDHVLLYGPPGLGKTTLAEVIANELGVNIKTISGPAIEKAGDLATILTSLTEGDVLFIDEIHRIPTYIEEILYSAMEDYYIDIVIGQDQTSRSIRIDLPPFTLVGATTRFGDLSSPLRDRFGVVLRLNYYTKEELDKIIRRTAKVYNTEIENMAVSELSLRSRGTPRIANRLFRRIRDFAYILNNGIINLEICKTALDKLSIDSSGLDEKDFKYLKCILYNFGGGPVGVDTISSSIGEVRQTIEDVYEPYLLQEGYIQRTSRGRVLTKKTYDLLNIKTKG